MHGNVDYGATATCRRRKSAASRILGALLTHFDFARFSQDVIYYSPNTLWNYRSPDCTTRYVFIASLETLLFIQISEIHPSVSFTQQFFESCGDGNIPLLRLSDAGTWREPKRNWLWKAGKTQWALSEPKPVDRICRSGRKARRKWAIGFLILELFALFFMRHYWMASEAHSHTRCIRCTTYLQSL